MPFCRHNTFSNALFPSKLMQKIHFLSKFRFKKDRNFCYIELHKKLGQHCSFDNDLMVFLQLKKMEAMRNYCMVEEGDRKLSDE